MSASITSSSYHPDTKILVSIPWPPAKSRRSMIKDITKSGLQPVPRPSNPNPKLLVPTPRRKSDPTIVDSLELAVNETNSSQNPASILEQDFGPMLRSEVTLNGLCWLEIRKKLFEVADSQIQRAQIPELAEVNYPKIQQFIYSTQGVELLGKFQSLDLSISYIDNLPVSLLFCKELRDLNLSGNFFTKLPISILERLPNLETLDLSNNKLKSLPEAILNLKKLKHLNLKGNPNLRVSKTMYNQLISNWCKP